MAKMQIKRIGVFSYAKISALVMAFFGVIIGVIYGLIFMIFGAAIMAGGGRDGAGAGVGGVVMGLVFIVAFPIFYGIIGFIAGALGALVYNVAAGFMGGVEIELENVEADYATPPPPQWGANQYNQPGGGQQYPYS